MKKYQKRVFGRRHSIVTWLAVGAGLVFAAIGVKLLLPSSAAVSPRLPWPSGITVGTPSAITAWESFRGSAVGAIHAFAARSNWSEVESAGWIMGYYKSSPELLVISQPFWPEGTGGSMSACASGSYDANWKRYGSMLQASGRKDKTVTRLAWEFNGDWFQWSSRNPTEWKACWRKVVTAVRSTAPGAKFEWAMNAHGSQESDGDAWKSYPGDDVVDLVGIDPYDHYPASRTAAEFDEQCNDSEGLCNVIKFARQHGKKVGVGEWGVAKDSSNGGGGAGDNPVYIQKMYETFYAARDVMGYETYFNEEAYGNALVNPRQNPRSADLYVSLFGAKSPAITNPTPTPPTPTPPNPTPPTPTPPTPTPPSPGIKTPDLDKNGRVDLFDLSILLAAWNTNRADITGDGKTNLFDLSRLLAAWTYRR